MKQINYSITALFLLLSFGLFSQTPSDSLKTTSAKEELEAKQEIIKAIQKGIVIPLDKKEKSWMKILVFTQTTGTYNDAARQNETIPATATSSVLNYDRREKNFEVALTRARFITAANFFDKVFFFSQFGTAGLGGINNDNLNILAQEKQSQLSLITLYSELNFHKSFNVGVGLHNYRGVSRFSNAGLVDLITQDLDTGLIPTFAHADQFSYPLGVFVKGLVGKFRYQVAIDEASRNSISRELYQNVATALATSPLPAVARDLNNPLAPNTNHAVYRGAELLGGAKAGTTFSGYLTYHILEEESDRISFRTGSYFGTKNIFNIGAGFFYHPNGSVIIDGNGKMQGQNVNIIGADVYYDAPINSKKDAISIYGLFQNMDYGKNFNLSQYNTGLYPLTADTLNTKSSLPFANGTLQYFQMAYFNKKTKIQPYGFFQNRTIDVTKENERIFGGGLNYLLVGPNVKLTAEYRNAKLASNPERDQVILQLIFFM